MTSQTTTTRRRTRMAFVALSAGMALTLSGCVTAFFPPAGGSSTSTPTGEDVAENLRSFYEQQLNWTGCEKDMQCATATAPMDWDNPGDGEIELALVRTQAGGDPIGSLLVNPGGPGASGFDFVAESVDYATDERLQDNFDIVGFDPQGSGQVDSRRMPRP